MMQRGRDVHPSHDVHLGRVAEAAHARGRTGRGHPESEELHQGAARCAAQPRRTMEHRRQSTQRVGERHGRVELLPIQRDAYWYVGALE